jgi:hypothetical protein
MEERYENVKLCEKQCKCFFFCKTVHEKMFSSAGTAVGRRVGWPAHRAGLAADEAAVALAAALHVADLRRAVLASAAER